MRAVVIIYYVVVSLFLGYCGWLLIFRTCTIVSRAHRTYGYNFFLKPWYSTLMRSLGLFILSLSLLADYALVTWRSH